MTWLSRWKSRMRKSKEAATQSLDARDSRVGDVVATAASQTASGMAPLPGPSQDGTEDVEMTEMERQVAVLAAENRLTECANTLRKVVERSKATLGFTNPETCRRLLDLGHTLSADGQHAEAERVFRELLAECERFGGETPGVFAMTRSVAEQMFLQGRFAEADALLRPSVLRSRDVLGATHRCTALGMVTMARLSLARGNNYDAAIYYQSGLDLCERCADLGRNHEETLSVLDEVSDLHRAAGRTNLAQEFALRGYERRNMQLGAWHRRTRAAHAKLFAMLQPGEEIRPHPSVHGMFQIYSNGLPLSRHILWVLSMDE